MTLASTTRLSAAVLLACLAGAQEEPEEPALHLRVNRAITRAVEHLQAIQEADGRWRGGYEERYPGGYTAFCLYALRRSGVRPRDEGILRGLRALADLSPISTYGAAARLLFYETQLPHDPALREPAEACARFLVDNQRSGLWGYPADPLDMSNVQLALLGLRAARKMGIEVPEGVWLDCADAIWDFQARDGGFFYHANDNRTAGITAATLAGVALLEEVGRDHRRVASLLKKKKRERERAHAWLVERWDPARDAYGTDAWTSRFPFAFLWAVERYGGLAGVDLLGEHDWYAEGAEHLLAIQKEDGSFGEKLEQTCFSLLFLRRATLSGGPDLRELYASIDADWKRERTPEPPVVAADVPFLTDWLVAGPFRGKRDATGLAEPPFKPERVKVRPRGKVGREKWKATTLKADGWTNLDEHTGAAADQALWVLGTRLEVEKEDGPVEALLFFDFEDGWRVLLDGEELSTGRRVSSAIRADVRVPLVLEPGVHELVVLSEDVGGSAVFGARLAARDGSRLTTPVRVGP